MYIYIYMYIYYLYLYLCRWTSADVGWMPTRLSRSSFVILPSALRVRSNRRFRGH